MSADSRDDQAMAVADAGYRAIACDRRGFGRSSQPWTGYDDDSLADDLTAVIAQTGAQDVTLVGFSMGGGDVARDLSRHGGETVIKTVLVSSAVPYMLKSDDNPDGIESPVFDQMAGDMKQDRAVSSKGFFKAFRGVSLISHPVSAELQRWSQGTAMRTRHKATLACAKSSLVSICAAPETTTTIRSEAAACVS